MNRLLVFVAGALVSFGVQAALTVSVQQDALVDGNNDFTETSAGTPCFVLTAASGGTANGTAVDEANFGVGVFDGTNDYAYMFGEDHGENDSDPGSDIRDDTALQLIDGDNNTLADEVASFITDGTRLTSQSAPSAAYLATILQLFGVSCTNAATWSATFDTDTPDSQAVNVGFEPDFVISFSDHGTSFNGISTQSYFSLGWSDGTNQYGYCRNSVGGQAATTAANAIWNDAVGCQWNFALNYELTVHTFTSSGFTVTRDADNDADIVVGLAIALSDYSVVLGTANVPTSTGVQTWISGLADQPELVMGLLTTHDSYGSVESSGGAVDSFGLLISDCTNTYVTGYSTDDGADPTDTQSLTDNAFRIDDDNGGAAYDGTLSCDGDGVNLDLSVAAGGTNPVPYMALVPSADTLLPLVLEDY